MSTAPSNFRYYILFVTIRQIFVSGLNLRLVLSNDVRLAQFISAARSVSVRCLIVVRRCVILSLAYGKGDIKNVKSQHEQ